MTIYIDNISQYDWDIVQYKYCVWVQFTSGVL